jgi:adenosine deaminase
MSILEMIRARGAVPQSQIAAFVKGMPKAELHIHIEGSLEPELMFALARRNGMQLPYANVEALRSAYVFDSLQSFLDLYHAGTMVLKTEQDFYDMTMAYLVRAHQDHVLHTEIFFDTQTHTGHGVAAEVVVNGIWRACQTAGAQWGMSSGLILCFLRHLSEEEAFTCLEEVLPLRDKLLGIGLASSEVGHPPAKFKRVFAKCRDLGFRLVAHAGEEGPPEYVWSALDDLKVERIDHGVRALEDTRLVQRLVQDKIPLTVCPFSNVKLRVFDTLKDHNLKHLLDQGLMATVNSDDPSYFGGYIAQNFTDTFAALGLGLDHAYTLARNSFDASFVQDGRRRELVDALDQYASEFLA